MDYEELCVRIRNWLQSKHIKLWEYPYTLKEAAKSGDEEIEKLVTEVESVMSSPRHICAQIIEQHRQHALENLRHKKHFDETQIATLKIKCPKQLTSNTSSRIINIELHLASSTGYTLRESIANQLNISINCVKVITSGCVIKDDVLLEDQKVKNNSQCILLISDETNTSSATQQEAEEFRKAEQAAGYLADKSIDDKFHTDQFDLQITDQNGKPLQLPNEEKRALTLALAMHEKGKAVMQRRAYTAALPMLMLSDEEFRKCTGTILESVDNFSLLQLDIVWCFLNLERITELPDAQRRLQECEVGVRRCYGDNFERSRRVKGTSGSAELIVIFRLHLLKAIVSFYQNRLEETRALLIKAKQEYNKLVVNDNLVEQVMELGFSAQQARIGLRSCESDVPATIEFLFRQQEERKAARRSAREDKKKKVLEKRLGLTADGSGILPTLVDTLVSMGFRRPISLEAVRQANNQMDRALELLESYPDQLQLEMDKRRMHGEDISGNTALNPMDTLDSEAVQELMQIFSAEIEVVKKALLEAGGSKDQAIELLMSGQMFSGASSSVNAHHHFLSNEDKEAEDAVVSTLLPDISSPDDYVDADMSEEIALLLRYASLISLDTDQIN